MGSTISGATCALVCRMPTSYNTRPTYGAHAALRMRFHRRGGPAGASPKNHSDVRRSARRRTGVPLTARLHCRRIMPIVRAALPPTSCASSITTRQNSSCTRGLRGRSYLDGCRNMRTGAACEAAKSRASVSKDTTITSHWLAQSPHDDPASSAAAL